jgi:putative tryptophan/tyrosine transport system substrate-binding protein
MKRRDFVALLGGAAGLSVAPALVARAEPPAMSVLGFMSARSPEDSAREVAAFRRGLEENGWTEGRNLKIEYRWARGDYTLLPALAAELVGLKINVLMAGGGDASALAAKTASSTVPIVFIMGGDPIKAGLVNSYNRPGRNATGCVILSNDIEAKRLGLLREIVPEAMLFGAMLNPSFPPSAGQLHDLDTAAAKIGRPLFIGKASNDAELNASFAAFIGAGVNALVVASDPFFDTRRKQIIAFAAELRLPAIYHNRGYPFDGGLVSYGPNIPDAYHRAGVYSALILSGTQPDDLPVTQPTQFDFVINLKTAKSLEISISAQLLARADEVIE